MKTFRILGAIFCVFGCIFALIGILTSILPMIENEQFQTIVSSFQQTSSDSLTNTLNSIVLFCLHSGYFLLFCGISLTVAGGLISSSAHKRQKALMPEAEASTSQRSADTANSFPKPAYYPGGMAPSTLPDEEDEEISDPIVVSTIPGLKPSPISGGVEPAFSSDESDSHKLMENDVRLQSESQAEKEPEYIEYLSNQAQTDPESAAEILSHPVQHKPKIVSTMGKRRF